MVDDFDSLMKEFEVVMPMFPVFCLHYHHETVEVIMMQCLVFENLDYSNTSVYRCWKQRLVW